MTASTTAEAGFREQADYYDERLAAGRTLVVAAALTLKKFNPDIPWVFIPLRDGDRLGDEGKIPLIKNWAGYEQSVPITDPLWEKATGFGTVLTRNRRLLVIDIDKPSKLTLEQRRVIDAAPGLFYRTRGKEEPGTGEHHLYIVEENKYPPMNGKGDYDLPFGEIWYIAERQIALAGSANKPFPPDCRIPADHVPPLEILLANPASKEDRKPSRHDTLMSVIGQLVNQGWNNEEDIFRRICQEPEYQSLAAEPDRKAEEETRRGIAYALKNRTSHRPPVDEPPPSAYENAYDATATVTGKKPVPGAADYAEHVRTALHTRPDLHNRLWAYNPETGSYNKERAEAAITRQIIRHAKTLEHKISATLINGAIQILKADKHLISYNNATTVAVLNGTLDIATRTLKEHSPNNGLPTYLPVRFLPEAECPKWVKFLDEVIPDKAEHRLLAQFAGACLPDRVPPKGALFLEGDFDSGKTVLIGTIIKLLGLHNVTSISPQMLNKPHMSDALRGKKANLVSDMSIEAMKDPAAWKQLTGEDPILFNPKFKDTQMGFVTCPSGYAVNKIPLSWDKTGAVAIRRYIIKTAGTIPKNKQNPKLAEELAEELPGILNWAIQGYLDLAASGWKWHLSAGQAEQQRQAVLIESPMKLWASENIGPKPGGFLLKTAAADNHIQWLIDNRLLDKPDDRYDEDGNRIENNPRMNRADRNRLYLEINETIGTNPTRRGNGWGWANWEITTYKPEPPRPAAEPQPKPPRQMTAEEQTEYEAY